MSPRVTPATQHAGPGPVNGTNEPQTAPQGVSRGIAPRLRSEPLGTAAVIRLSHELRHANGAVTISNTHPIGKALANLVADYEMLMQSNVKLLGRELDRMEAA